MKLFIRRKNSVGKKKSIAEIMNEYFKTLARISLQKRGYNLTEKNIEYFANSLENGSPINEDILERKGEIILSNSLSEREILNEKQITYNNGLTDISEDLFVAEDDVYYCRLNFDTSLGTISKDNTNYIFKLSYSYNLDGDRKTKEITVSPLYENGYYILKKRNAGEVGTELVENLLEFNIFDEAVIIEPDSLPSADSSRSCAIITVFNKEILPISISIGEVNIDGSRAGSYCSTIEDAPNISGTVLMSRERVPRVGSGYFILRDVLQEGIRGENGNLWIRSLWGNKTDKTISGIDLDISFESKVEYDELSGESSIFFKLPSEENWKELEAGIKGDLREKNIIVSVGFSEEACKMLINGEMSNTFSLLWGTYEWEDTGFEFPELPSSDEEIVIYDVFMESADSENYEILLRPKYEKKPITSETYVPNIAEELETEKSVELLTESITLDADPTPLEGMYTKTLYHNLSYSLDFKEGKKYEISGNYDNGTKEFKQKISIAEKNFSSDDANELIRSYLLYNIQLNDSPYRCELHIIDKAEIVINDQMGSAAPNDSGSIIALDVYNEEETGSAPEVIPEILTDLTITSILEVNSLAIMPISKYSEREFYNSGIYKRKDTVKEKKEITFSYDPSDESKCYIIPTVSIYDPTFKTPILVSTMLIYQENNKFIFCVPSDGIIDNIYDENSTFFYWFLMVNGYTEGIYAIDFGPILKSPLNEIHLGTLNEVEGVRERIDAGKKNFFTRQFYNYMYSVSSETEAVEFIKELKYNSRSLDTI